MLKKCDVQQTCRTITKNKSAERMMLGAISNCGSYADGNLGAQAGTEGEGKGGLSGP